MSSCLPDFLPGDQDSFAVPWRLDLPSVLAAATQAPATSDPVHILAVSVPTADSVAVLTMVQPWMAGSSHPVRLNLEAASDDQIGEACGFEVIGVEHGRFHSWLCYGQHEQVHTELKIVPNDFGLFSTVIDARAATNMANNLRGTRDGAPEYLTWFPVRVAEYPT